MSYFCQLTGKSKRKDDFFFRKKIQRVYREQYREGMMGVMCLYSTVKAVLDVLEMPARNPIEVRGGASSSLQGLERGGEPLLARVCEVH